MRPCLFLAQYSVITLILSTREDSSNIDVFKKSHIKLLKHEVSDSVYVVFLCVEIIERLL